VNDAPIGVFDSGVGGLSVLRAIRYVLPAENLLYVADSGFAPYGDRPDEFIRQRAAGIVEFCAGAGAKAIVVACNTATAVAIAMLRARFTLPIVAIEPAVKPAAAMTRSGVIGVLATRQTLASASFARLVETCGAGMQILLQPCPGLVELVEAGELAGPRTAVLVGRYVTPLVARGADTLVLGCTHYPFLGPVIRAAAGPGVTLLDPAMAVAKELQRRLAADDLVSRSGSPGGKQFWTSGAPNQVQPVVSRLWGQEVEILALPAALSALGAGRR
jgi:glutamate racemase